MTKTLTGVKIATDLKGKPQTVPIDLNKNLKLINALEKASILKAKKTFSKKQSDSKEDFSKDCLTLEQFIKKTHDKIDKWPVR